MGNSIKLGYTFTHTIRKAKDGILEVNHYLKNENGEIFLQGFSTITKEGVLFNVFDVTVQQQEVSTAMYTLLEKIGFVKVEAQYGSGSLGTNYAKFMEVFEKTNDKVLAAKETPAGKALNKVFNNQFDPTEIKIEKNKIYLFWVRKK